MSGEANDELLTQKATALNNILNPTFGELLEAARLILI